MRKTRRKPGTSDTFAIGDCVRKVEGVRNLGEVGIVTDVLGTFGGDTLVEVNTQWTAYDRQLEREDS